MITNGKSTIALTVDAGRSPAGLRLALWGCLVAGAAAFAMGALGEFSQRAWQVYFVNFLFWSGIAQGGVVMAAVYRITNARWGDQFRRIGEGMISFLPISFLLFALLVAGGASLFPWLHDPAPGKAVWLSAPFLFGRDAAAFLLLLLLSSRFVYHSVRPDLGLTREGERISFVHKTLLKGWRNHAEEVRSSNRSLNRLTPIFLVSFAVLYSLLGFDLVMALDTEWYSTIFGWMFCLHAFYAELVVVAMLAVLSKSWLG